MIRVKMAQLLVFQRDNIHPDPIADRSGCYKKGDVVVVAEDSHIFSPSEKSFPFAVVSVPGAVSDCHYLTESEPAALPDKYPRAMLQIKRLSTVMSKSISGGVRRRRKYSIDNAGSITRKNVGVI